MIVTYPGLRWVVDDRDLPWPTMVRRDERWQIFASVRKKTESFCPAAGEQREARSEEEEEEQGEARLKTV
jgi:hypothetical protein